MKNRSLLEIIKNTSEEVTRLGYSDSSVERYTKVWNQLKEYCVQNEIDDYSVDVGNAFLEEIYNLKNTYFEKHTKNAYRSIMILNSYMCYGKIYTKYFIKQRTLCTEFQNIYDEYLSFCREKQNNAPKTINYKSYAVNRILFLCEDKDIKDFNLIDTNFIESYLNTLIDLSQNSLKLYIYTLRDFFSFLFSTNRVEIDLQYLIPKVKISKNASIPSVWDKDDVNKLIDTIDRNNPIGKRDYAMILLVAKLGIRTMDLKHLTTNDIDWKKKEITIVMSKTKKTLNLPLPNDVGWAIIDYLKNGRPVCDSKVIFIRHVAPIGPFNDNDALQGIIKKYINMANITFDNELHKKGMHSLRHSLATNLLKNNVPIDSISSILGQNNRGSVSYYLKVDNDKLIECCGNEDDYEI